MRARGVVLLLTLVAFAALPAFGQSVISAKSGLIHYVEGQVLLAGKPVVSKFGTYPELKEATELRTEDGRAEVLLNPGVFLRVAENSGVLMVSSRLTDTRIEFVSGAAVVESSGLLNDKDNKANSISILYKDTTVHLRKNGIYRFDGEPAQLRVFSGEAEVTRDAHTQLLHGGRLVALDNPGDPEKFDVKTSDALDRWSKRRAEYISMANLSAAKYVKDSGATWSGGWAFNPYFGLFTFIPGSGIWSSPYGFRFYTPGTIYRVYQAPMLSRYYYGQPSYNTAMGYPTTAHTASGYSGTISAARSSSAGAGAGAAASGSASHGSGHGGGHSR